MVCSLKKLFAKKDCRFVSLTYHFVTPATHNTYATRTVAVMYSGYVIYDQGRGHGHWGPAGLFRPEKAARK